MSDMKSVRHNNDFIVGLTVILFTVIVIASVLWLKQADIKGRAQTILVRTRDVGGITPGHPVVIRGVRAGRVQSILLGESGWVVLTLSIDNNITLPADPVVLIASSSLFGEWQATVASSSGMPADRELRSLIAEARTTHDTLPGAVLPDIAQLTSIAGRIAGDVAQVAERVQVAFDDDAAREMRESIRSFAKASSDLSQIVNRQMQSLDRITVEVEKGVASINETAAAASRIAARADSSTSGGELSQLIESSRRAADELLQAATRLRAVANDVDNTQRLLATTVQRTDSVIFKVNSGQGSLGMLVNDPHLYRSSDSLVLELRALVQDIKANPRRYFNLRVF